MKTKKNARVNLEKKRNFFFLLGLTITLGATLMAFEWRSDPQQLATFSHTWEDGIIELMPVTRPPEAPKPKNKTSVAIDFEVVEDDVEIEDIEIIDLEDTGEAIEEVEIDDPDDGGELIDFFLIEDKPEFVGGDEAFIKYLNTNIKYPYIAKENGIEGVVYVYFVVSKTGKIVDVKLERGTNRDLDEEALRVISAMPNWMPGKQRGIATSVSYRLPINFELH